MALQREDLVVGSFHQKIVVENLTRTQIVQYAGASGDYNPLHTDEVFATEVAGYPSVFAHGMLTMGLTGRMLTDYVGDGRLIRFRGRFLAQVWPGDDLIAKAVIAAIGAKEDGCVVELTVTTVKSDGTEVFAGTATARIDT